MTDIEIAQASKMLPIEEVAAKVGIKPEQLENYGHYKAKVDIHALKDLPRKSKLVLVTAISPTPAGEGKTTTSVGLADALNKMGKKTIVCLREPSLGPVFGVKGGAAGGGYAQVVPMEDINQARLDGYYVEHLSFGMDVKCFFGTIRAVLDHDGVVEIGRAHV